MPLHSFTATLLAILIATVPVVASEATTSELAPIDVELREGGVLLGQFVSATGEPVVGKEVCLQLADGREAKMLTGDKGAFAFRGVSGAARLTGPDCVALTRCWSPGSAPPGASDSVLLIENQQVTRAQRYAGNAANGFVQRSKRLMANPLFVTGLIATSVAVPVAIHNADDDDPTS